MKRRSYPADVTDTQWKILEPYFVVSYAKGGRPPKHSKRELLDSVIYT